MRHAAMLALLGLATSPALAAEPGATLTVGSVINGTSGGVVVGPPDEVRARALRLLGEAGLPTAPPASADGEPFDPGSARFVVNGLVTGQACHRVSNWTGCRWRIRWDIFDRRTRTVAWRASSVGEASVAQSMATSGMYHDIVMDSLRVVAQDAPLAQRLASADPSAAPVAPAWEQPIDIRLCGGPPTQVDALAGAFVRLGDTGTATVISPDGFALTSARLVEGLRSTEVTRAGGSVASARVVRVDEVADVALLAVEGAEQACVPPTRDKAKVGDPAISVVAADEGIATAAGGLTSEGESSGLRMFEVSAAAYAIGPGGAVLDDQSRLLGVRVRPVDSAEYGVLPSALVPGRLGIQGAAASTSDLDAVQRIAKTNGEPLGPVATEEPALVPPRAPGRTSTVITDVPGALEMSAGGTMLAVGGSVALITGGLWAQEASNPWTLTNNGPTYAAITITGAAVAAGGGALLAVGWRKQQAAQQAELTLGPSHIGVRGRF